MGDNFLLRQVKNFRKRRDLAITELNTPRLFERPDVLSTVYTAMPFEQESFRDGELLYAVATRSERVVPLVRGHRKVGYIDGDGATALREGLGEPDSSGVAVVKVVATAALSGAGQVTLIRSVQGHG